MSYVPPPGFPQEPSAKKTSYWWWVVPLVLLFGAAVIGFYVLVSKDFFDEIKSITSQSRSEADFYPS
ncbi:MAG: hypothetical protein KF812_13255, partial [Fimbriimonadaceae bacterium]|nr:hypothetical protein [Fimbriimonadaceae bacterium]